MSVLNINFTQYPGVYRNLWLSSTWILLQVALVVLIQMVYWRISHFFYTTFPFHLLSLSLPLHVTYAVVKHFNPINSDINPYPYPIISLL